MGFNLKANIGRADLVRLLALGGDQARQEDFARLCGLEKIEAEETRAEKVPQGAADERAAVAGPGGISEPAEKARLGFWRIFRAEFSDDEEQTEYPGWFLEVGPITRSFLRDAPRPPEERPFPLLSPWSRLWPFLRRELSVVGASRAVDTRTLVRHIARCRPVRHVPRRRILRWANSIHLLYDTSGPMRTFSNDMDELAGRLGMICGRHRLKRFIFPQGIAERGYTAGKGPGSDSLLAYRAPEQSTSVLALSDLGGLTEDRATGKWAMNLGRALVLSGSRAVALMPCPPWRWHPMLGQSWRLAWWDMGRRPFVPALRAINSQEGAGDRSTGKSVREPSGLDDFLRLMSPVVRPDPELIRYIRALLPAEQTDAGLEADIWMGRYDYQSRLDEFASIEPLARRKQLVDLLNWFHADFPEIRGEEITIIQSKDKELASRYKSETDKINAMLAVSLDDRRWLSQGFSEGEFIGYVKRREERLPDSAYKNDRVAATWVLAHLQDNGTLDTDDVPSELPMDKVAWALKPGKIRHYRLAQVGDSISAMLEGDIEAGRNASPLGVLTSRTDYVFVKSLDASRPTKKRWPIHEPGPEILTPALKTRRYRIEATGAVVELEQIPKPDWAREMGRNQHGLFARLHDNRCFYWLNPGRYKFEDQKGVSTVELKDGCWLQEKKYLKHLDMAALTADWKEHLAEDQYGLYEVIFIRGIRQVFRWIPPGRFLMGSPSGEPERDDNEQQHEVELTRGYWLADTACTQALWEAVMGENPSHFKGPERPVEMVSWRDCQKFIGRINQELPHLNLRLPTEAQWEYACRAGTTTPFWFGKTVTPEQVNYNGDFPYAEGSKGKNREQTVEVKSLPPNGWGLYEMHGNVYEWCSDWYGPYEEGRAVDPHGPSKGEYRVVRGGSWISSAGDCRSAYRSWLGPAKRSRYLGFRLSPGQEGQEQENGRKARKEGRAEGGGVERSRTGSARRIIPKNDQLV